MTASPLSAPRPVQCPPPDGYKPHTLKTFVTLPARIRVFSFLSLRFSSETPRVTDNLSPQSRLQTHPQSEPTLQPLHLRTCGSPART
jgi:hypothetical protein